MERYINQLIGDIATARTRVKAPSHEWDYVDFENDGEIEDMAYAEEYIYGKAEPLSQITGIETEMLPPPEMLTDAQQEKLVKELETLLLHHNFIADFPQLLPKKEKYPFIRNIWDQKYVELSFGTNHIEFCDFDSDNCPFPEHCTICEEIKIQMKIDEEQEKRNGSPGTRLPGDEDMDDYSPFF